MGRVVDRILRRRGLQGRSIAEEPLRSPHSRLLQNLLLSLEDLLCLGIGSLLLHLQDLRRW